MNAARDYVREKTKDKVVDFEVAWSVEYVDPPAHLLRGHGDNVVGYHYLAKDGKFDVVDGPLESADVRAIYPYDPFAVGLRMNTDQWVAWVTENGAKYRDQVKSTGDMSKARLISDLMAGQGNDIREEFLSQRTA